MDHTKTLANVIRDAIEKDQRTRYRISVESGVNQAVLGRFVHRERDVSLATADKLCRVLGLRLTDGADIARNRRRRQREK